MLENDDILEGYRDGKSSDLQELPVGNNRSETYQLGWRNGRDDRISRPRALASDIRIEAADITAREASYP